MHPSHLIAWRFCDGNIGHEKQSQALLEGLARHASVESYDIAVAETAAERWLQRLLERSRSCEHLPAPDLIIGAGHRTHAPILTARRMRGGKTIVLMKPSLPVQWFDLAIIPEHDRYAASSNIMSSRTVLAPSLNNRPDKRKGIILVGGGNRHFQWSNDNICGQIESFVRATPKVQWQLSTSRRTPKDFKAPALDNLQAYDYRELDKDWTNMELAQAGNICISADSASMLAEALNSRAHVTVLPLTSKRRKNKLLWAAEHLQKQGLARLYDGDGQSFAARQNQSVMSLDEHFRCARLLLQSLYGTADVSTSMETATTTDAVSA